MENVDLQAVAESVLRRLFIELEASGRHVHVTKEQANILFGHDLTPKRPLSQPGQFLASEAQVEVSLTDGRSLGITPPVRMSGSVAGSPGCTLVGEKGRVTIDHGVIAAQRHIHMTPEDAKAMGVKDKQNVRLQVFTERPVIFEDVAVRVREDFATFVHLDYDEANACGFQNGDLGRILP